MTVWIDDNLAVTPMPAENELEALAQIFKAVVVLVEEWELGYDLQAWNTFGVTVRHQPIPDFGTPSLDDLRELTEWMKKETGDGNVVLVHCFGGIGRSGMVAAAYLIANGCDVNEAIQQVQSRVCNALKIDEQVALVRQFARTV
jgi:protein-tyrosine phosphatase